MRRAARKVTIRHRWGVQSDWAIRSRGERADWRLIGVGWMIDRTEIEAADFWPASFRTRARARREVNALHLRHATHSSEPWRFRAVKLELRTRVLR